jgi:hypothetical protein
LSMPHLSINACTVSSLATPASAALSSSAVVASDSSFAKSLLFVGLMKAKVKGMMLGKRIAAATLSLNGKERSRELYSELYQHMRLTVKGDTYGYMPHKRLTESSELLTLGLLLGL